MGDKLSCCLFIFCTHTHTRKHDNVSRCILGYIHFSDAHPCIFHSEGTRQPIKQQREPGKYAIFLRSKRKVILSGSETEEEARAAENQPISIPQLPTFNDVHEQRVHMKQKLAAGFRIMAQLGYDEGVAGLCPCDRSDCVTCSL